MVERIAKVLAALVGRDYAACSRAEKKTFRANAVMILEIMKRPTDQMLDTGSIRIDRGGAYLVWLSMINTELLKESINDEPS